MKDLLTKIMGISSGKGGVGKTTVAINLAYALKQFGKTAVIIDCNISTPHVGYYIGAFEYNATINDVLRGKANIAYALHQNNGIIFVPASLQLKDLIGIEPMKFKRYVNKLRNPDKIDFVLLDSAPGLGREAISVLDAADEVMLVTTPHVPMINDVLRCRDIINELGDKTFKIVVNMVSNKKCEMVSNAIENITDAAVIGSIPFDRNVEYSLAIKEPIVKCKPNSAASIAFMRLAARLIDEQYKPPLKGILYQFYDRMKGIFVREQMFMPETKEEMFL